MVHLPFVPSTSLPCSWPSLDKNKSPVYILRHTIVADPRSYELFAPGNTFPDAVIAPLTVNVPVVKAFVVVLPVPNTASNVAETVDQYALPVAPEVNI